MDVTFLALLLPFLAAILAPLLVRGLGGRAALVLALVPALLFWHFASFLPPVMRGEAVSGGFAWVPALQLTYCWYLDGLSLGFALMVTGIGTLIVLYAGAYLAGQPGQGRFFAFLMAFMGSMLGLVVSDSFLMLFVHWELTAITSFLLIGFDHQRMAARRAALQALVVTGGGGLCLLAGLLLLSQATGTSQFSQLLGLGAAVRSSPFYAAIFVLVVLGAFTKSAQFPFHFWLPNAMQAPTPVSAYLHSATMVKAGVFLLMRLLPVMGGTLLWSTVLPIAGGITLVAGTMLALRQTDMKLMLAQTTVASLGLMVMLTGMGSDRAVEAAVLYLLSHALFKGALFMAAGLVDHGTGSRDLSQLGGLWREMPLTALIGGLAALSMAGVLPFAGFLAKEEIYAALTEDLPRTLALLLTGFAGNVLMAAAGFEVGFRPFFGRRRRPGAGGHGHHGPKDGPLLFWAGPLLLAVAGAAAGVCSGWFHATIGNGFASAVSGHPVVMEISAMPHPGLPLALSLLTLALGLWLCLNMTRVRAALERLFSALGPGPDRGFDRALSLVTELAAASVRRVQSGRLSAYLGLTFAALALLLPSVLVARGELPGWPSFTAPVPLYEAGIVLLAVAGLVAVVVVRDRLVAIVCLGLQGYAVGLVYLLYGAPDLAFTQFMVETLAVVILTLVMTRLNLASADRRTRARQILDGAIACGAASGIGLMLLAILGLPFDIRLSAFFNQASRLVAHGGNVVNVIIVDFRGTDTLGEITVVLIAGLSILALIRLRLQPRRRLADNNPDAGEGP
nr:putative monovalent cation/H+ antiporter subunit A [uncultured Gellertiella sp.]